MHLNEVTKMKLGAMQLGIAVVALGSWLAGVAIGQEAPAAQAPAQPKNTMRPAYKWKRTDYSCEGGAKLTVYVHNQTAKVVFQEHLYLMKSTESREGNRYSDGKVLWWWRESGGFLQEDAPDGYGKMIVKGCMSEKP